jgi:hypothetical protein
LPTVPFRQFALVAQVDHGNQQVAQLYLIGVYELAQDEHRSCTPRGSSSPEILVKIYSDYMCVWMPIRVD